MVSNPRFGSDDGYENGLIRKPVLFQCICPQKVDNFIIPQPSKQDVNYYKSFKSETWKRFRWKKLTKPLLRIIVVVVSNLSATEEWMAISAGAMYDTLFWMEYNTGAYSILSTNDPSRIPISNRQCGRCTVSYIRPFHYSRAMVFILSLFRMICQGDGGVPEKPVDGFKALPVLDACVDVYSPVLAPERQQQGTLDWLDMKDCTQGQI